MINRDSYKKEEIDALYNAVENAMAGDHILDLTDIAYLIHEGDFYLRDVGRTLHFCFNGLRWVKDGSILTVIVQAQGDPYDSVGVKWVIVDCVDERDFLHQGDPAAIDREYRYIK